MTAALPLAAAASPLAAMGEVGPGTLVLTLVLLSLLPFALMMTTSFLKFAVVLSILRTALGTQQTPPNMVLLGLSGVLTLHVMAPVGVEILDAMEASDRRARAVQEQAGRRGAEPEASPIGRYLEAAQGPMRTFLQRHAHPDDVAMFFGQALARAARAGADVGAAPGKPAGELGALPPTVDPAGAGIAAAAPRPSPDPGVPSFEAPAELDAETPTAPRVPREDDLLVLVPAFVLSELSEAFAIGFLLFLPFLVIDLVVGNILLAMGMHMLSPVVVSLPFKLLLFVMLDGWRLVVEGLLQPYLI
ncbi:MAG: flagellar type III secretion system pore protein FliP [Acidobacteriota bacterium]